MDRVGCSITRVVTGDVTGMFYYFECTRLAKVEKAGGCLILLQGTVYTEPRVALGERGSQNPADSSPKTDEQNS